MTKMIATVVLILVQSVLGTEAQNIGPCIDALLNSDKAGGNICPAAEEYARCFFMSLNVPTWSLSETELTNLENALEKNLTAIGIHCDIDIRAILRKVKGDKSNAATRITNKPTGYNDAVTIEDCVNALNRATTQAGGRSCSLITLYLKCTIRVTGLYKFDPHSSTYSEIFSFLETQIETGLRLFGLNCNFDIKELSTEVASEQNYKNSESGLHTSVRGMMSLYTVTVAAWICSYFFQY
ncbi:hypothetical protein BsWGS_09437 [Bradybaena similaris]